MTPCLTLYCVVKDKIDEKWSKMEKIDVLCKNYRYERYYYRYCLFITSYYQFITSLKVWLSYWMNSWMRCVITNITSFILFIRIWILFIRIYVCITVIRVIAERLLVKTPNISNNSNITPKYLLLMVFFITDSKKYQ